MKRFRAVLCTFMVMVLVFSGMDVAADVSDQMPETGGTVITPSVNYGPGWYLVAKEYTPSPSDYYLSGASESSTMTGGELHDRYTCTGEEGELYPSHVRYVGSESSPSYYNVSKTTYGTVPDFMEEGGSYSIDVANEVVESNWAVMESAQVQFSSVYDIGYGAAGDINFRDSDGSSVVNNRSAVLTSEYAIPGERDYPMYLKVNVGSKYGYVYTFEWFDSVEGTAGTDSSSSDGRILITFSDFDSSHWAYTYVEYMVGLGIVSGYPDGSFRPDDTFNRGAFAKLLQLSFEMPYYTGNEVPYTDLPADHWAYIYVMSAFDYLTAYEKSDGTQVYLPEGVAVREDVAVAMVKAMGLDPDDADLSYLDSYTDQGDISVNLRNHVALAIEYGVMQGANGLFRPQDPLTRAEACTLFARFLMEIKGTYDESSSEDDFVKITN